MAQMMRREDVISAPGLIVYALFDSRPQAESAVDALRERGFASDDISVLFADIEDSNEFAEEKHSKAPEAAAIGATTGAVVGGILGWLAGIGAIALPGVGPLIAAGPIMAALAGTGVGGAAGGIAGALVGLGMPEFAAERYEASVREGNILMSVHCLNAMRVVRATETLKFAGARDIASAWSDPPQEQPQRSEQF